MLFNVTVYKDGYEEYPYSMHNIEADNEDAAIFKMKKFVAENAYWDDELVPIVARIAQIRVKSVTLSKNYNSTEINSIIPTGLIRSFDDLGRINIPKDIRKIAFGTSDVTGKPMKIFYEKDGTIILKPCEYIE